MDIFQYFQSDRYGFNNPDKEWDSNEIELILVGDSFVFMGIVFLDLMIVHLF